MTVHTTQHATGWKATDDQYPRVYGEGETEQAAIEDLRWQVLDDQDEHLQRNIAKGLADGAHRIAAYVGMLCIALWLASKIWPADRDATDPAEGERSGMRLYTDAQTGCQYSATSGGSLTPRLSATGEHICDR